MNTGDRTDSKITLVSQGPYAKEHDLLISNISYRQWRDDWKYRKNSFRKDTQNSTATIE